MKPRLRLSPELKELLVWIPYSAQETTLDIDSNRLMHWLSAWDASFMGRLGRGKVALRPARVLRGDGVPFGYMGFVYVIILDTVVFRRTQKILEIRKNVKNAYA